MLQSEYRRELERLGPQPRELERLYAALKGETMQRKPVVKTGRRAAVLLAACAALLLTAAAAVALGALDFLKKQDGFAFLGQTEVYETYAVPVEQSVTAENGDVFTVERVATDGKFCTVFYSVRFQEAVVTAEELAEMQKEGIPSTQLLWNACVLNCSLSADGEELSLDGYNNSFEPQEYFADEHTLYGAWRILLRRPLEEGTPVTLQAGMWTLAARDEDQVRAWYPTWDISLDFVLHPIAREHAEPGTVFPMPLQGTTVQAQVLSFDRSPLGTLLTVRYERLANMGLGPDFVLRDAATGAYIPFAEVQTSHSWDPEGYYDCVYELFGDVSALKDLEVIPAPWIGPSSPRKTVRLEDLPCKDSGNPAGGYAPASYTVGDGRLIVTMEPVGAADGTYAALGNGVYFLDENGEELFSGGSTQKFKNRTDGTITVVRTPDAESFQEDVDKVAQIWFFVQRYELLENMAVTIPLTD